MFSLFYQVNVYYNGDRCTYIGRYTQVPEDSSRVTQIVPQDVGSLFREHYNGRPKHNSTDGDLYADKVSLKSLHNYIIRSPSFLVT